MLLYHYATKKFETLKTKQAQGIVTPKDMNESLDVCKEFYDSYGVRKPGNYYEHISFFFDKIPDDITRFFPHNHEIWRKGNVIYEHVVDLSKCEHFMYEVVEFPEKTKLRYDDSLNPAQYVHELGKVYRAKKYIGKNIKELTAIVKSEDLVKEQNRYFEKLLIRSDYKEISQKYAASVPHVMLYPAEGVMEVSGVNKITLR